MLLRFRAEAFVSLVTFLELANAGADSKLAELTPPEIDKLPSIFDQFGLVVTLKHFQDIVDQVDRQTGSDKDAADIFLRHASALAATHRRELSTKLFLAVTGEQPIQLFESERPFDTDKVSVNDRFPLAVYDIQEAANCLALSRATACVCHLMRVLEIGLQALADELGVPFSTQLEWQDAINGIEGRIKLYEKGSINPLPPDWKDKKQFYAELATQFTHFKDAWRNYAMHARVSYDESKANIIFGSVRAFLRVLAKRLSSPNEVHGPS